MNHEFTVQIFKIHVFTLKFFGIHVHVNLICVQNLRMGEKEGNFPFLCGLVAEGSESAQCIYVDQWCRDWHRQKFLLEGEIRWGLEWGPRKSSFHHTLYIGYKCNQCPFHID